MWIAANFSCMSKFLASKHMNVWQNLNTISCVVNDNSLHTFWLQGKPLMHWNVAEAQGDVKMVILLNFLKFWNYSDCKKEQSWKTWPRKWKATHLSLGLGFPTLTIDTKWGGVKHCVKGFGIQTHECGTYSKHCFMCHHHSQFLIHFLAAETTHALECGKSTRR
jgi:hypothetical protein